MALNGHDFLRVFAPTVFAGTHHLQRIQQHLCGGDSDPGTGTDAF